MPNDGIPVEAQPSPVAPSVPRARGTVIKLPDTTAGLMIVDGQQKPFVLEGVWRVPAAPSVGMHVELELDALGAIVAVVGVDANAALREQGEQVAALARKGFGAAVDRMGKVPLAAVAVLWIGWFLVPAIKMGPFSLTFWDVLGIDASNLMSLMRGTSNHGFLAVLGLVAIAAPLGALRFKGPRVAWLNAAPAAFLLLVALGTWWSIHSAASDAEDASRQMLGGNAAMSGAMAAAQDAASQAMWTGVRDALSWGLLFIVVASGALLYEAIRAKPPLPVGLGGALAGAGAALGSAAGAAGSAARQLDPKKKRLIVGAAAAVAVLAVAGLVVAKLLKSPEERAVEAFEDVAAAASKNQNDCGAAGQAIGKAIEAHQDDNKLLLPLMIGETRGLEQRYGQRLEAARSSLMGVALRCAFDPGYASAMLASMQTLQQAASALDAAATAAATAAQRELRKPKQTSSPLAAAGLDALKSLLPTNDRTPAAGVAAQPPAPHPVAPTPPVTTPTVAAPAQVAPVVPAATQAFAPAPPPQPAATQGTIAAAPVAVATTFAVFGVESGDSLNVRAAPDSNTAKLLSLAPATTGLRSTGHTKTAGGGTWLELIAGSGTGWVNRSLVVEERPGACGDGRVSATIDAFSIALRGNNGAELAKTASPEHGLLVRTDVEHPTVHFDPRAVATLFAATAAEHFGNGGSEFGSFKDIVLPPLVSSLSGPTTRRCGTILPPAGDTRPASWPVELRALVPVSLTPTEPTIPTWVFGIEYVGGAPYVAALVEYAPARAATAVKAAAAPAPVAAKVAAPPEAKKAVEAKPAAPEPKPEAQPKKAEPQEKKDSAKEKDAKAKKKKK